MRLGFHFTEIGMRSQFSETLLDHLFYSGVIACLTIDNPKHAVPLAQSLLAGGINVMELTLRTPLSIESLRRIAAEVPEMLAGIGTILFPEQISKVVEAGGKFGVAPGLSEKVVKTAQDAGFPFAPGISTASELEHALELGCREMKFFPAEPMGGVSYIRSLSSPYAHLGVRFLPLGGITAHNMSDYLSLPSVLAIGGSWIVPPGYLHAENWGAVTLAAREASGIVREVRGRGVLKVS